MPNPTEKQLLFMRQVKNNSYSFGFVNINNRVLPDKSHIRACIWNKWISYENRLCHLTELGKKITS